MQKKRLINLAAIAIGAMILIVCGCGGGGGGNLTTGTSPGPSATPTPAPAFSISNLSSTMPTALTPLYISTTGLNLAQPVIVIFTASNGLSVSLPPIRTQNDGTVVVATPLHMDPTTGTTSSIAATVQISQGVLTSSSVPINIQDMPHNSDYGTNLGDISRAFYNYQQLSLALVQNGFQAIQKTPGNTVDTTAISAHVGTQLQNEILARNDVDRIVTTNNLQIGAGHLADGTSISFNSTSVDMMDRVLGLYLIALQPVISSTKLPFAAMDNPVRNHIKKRGQGNGGGLLMTERLTSNGSGFTSFLKGLGIVGNIGTIVAAIQTDLKSDATLFDKILASEAGAYAGLGIYGAVFAGTAGPEIVAASAVAGLVIGTIQVGVDIYKFANDPNSVLASTSPSSNTSALMAAQNALASKQGTLLLDSAGVVLGGLAFKGGISSLGQQVADFLQQDGSQAGLQGAAVIDTTLQVYANFASNDHKTAQDATGQFQQPFPSGSEGFGTLSGMVDITNSEGPILSGLSGIIITDPNTGSQFSSLGDPSGNYLVTVSLGNTTFNYSMMQISAFDPITSINQGSLFILSTQTLNLSGLNSLTLFAGPSLSGTCSDFDAGTGDLDDPDCD